LFGETNPVPVKYALSLLDVMPSRVRLPLTELGEHSKAEVTSILTYLRERYADDVLASDRNVQSTTPERVVSIG
jgi:dihydrodipicolinate synthase/N-acetylneuraminate lyase